jgi:transcriptional regulator with XRE-family HTH domain
VADHHREALPAYLRTPLGAVIRAWRQKRGFTLAELASRAGSSFTRGYLSQLETDRIHNPSEEKITRLAAALEIDPMVLVTREFPSTEASRPTDSEPNVVEPKTIIAAGVTADLSPLLTALANVSQSEQQLWVDALAALLEQVSVAAHSDSQFSGG